MHFKTFNLLAVLLAVLFLSSCADTSIKRQLYDDWWPIHATGTFDDGYFTASWDSDLGARGGLFITFTNKTDPSLKYDDVWYFDALSFAKDRKTFQYISIRNLDYETSRALKYYIKDKKIYFEIKNEAGRGTGEYGEGKDIKFSAPRLPDTRWNMATLHTSRPFRRRRVKPSCRRPASWTSIRPSRSGKAHLRPLWPHLRRPRLDSSRDRATISPRGAIHARICRRTAGRCAAQRAMATSFGRGRERTRASAIRRH